LERRGPDVSHEIETDLSESWKATFSGHTLWLQGDFPVPQPLVDSSGNILLWNGDVFYSQIGDECIPKGHSDTKFLLDKLENVETVEEICNTLESINGPWSLIYYKKSLNKIITGRDRFVKSVFTNTVDICCLLHGTFCNRFGRHSLLWNCLNGDGELACPQLIISSSSQCSTLCEIPASSLYQISFENIILVKKIYSRNLYAINKKPVPDHEFLGRIPHLLDSTSSDQIINDYLNIWQKEVEGLKAVLLESIKSRVHCQPMLCKACVLMHLIGKPIQCTHSKVAILFSGGLDSSVLAALTDRVWPENESIDLLNVAFPLRTENKLTATKFDVPDRLTGLQALEELRKLNPSRKWNFCEVFHSLSIAIFLSTKFYYSRDY